MNRIRRAWSSNKFVPFDKLVDQVKVRTDRDCRPWFTQLNYNPKDSDHQTTSRFECQSARKPNEVHSRYPMRHCVWAYIWKSFGFPTSFGNLLLSSNHFISLNYHSSNLFQLSLFVFTHISSYVLLFLLNTCKFVNNPLLTHHLESGIFQLLL